ncbi:MAG: PLDc N-terminal domain-containing protein [Candidatus Freyarchaeota archaeon]
MLLPLQFIMGVTYLVIALWCIVAIILAVWVYRDAEERGMEGALWLIIVLLTGIIGLIIYLIIRE